MRFNSHPLLRMATKQIRMHDEVERPQGGGDFGTADVTAAQPQGLDATGGGGGGRQSQMR